MSPIVGLINRALPWPKVGDIRKGELREVLDKDGHPRLNKYNKPVTRPVDLDHFKIILDAAYAHQQQMIDSLYGPTPQAIRIVLANDNIDRVWDFWYEAYIASQLIARSDGRVMYYWKDPETFEIKARLEDNIPMPQDLIVGKTSEGEPIKLKQTGRLNVVMPEIPLAGYFTLHTTSKTDIKTLTNHLNGVQEFAGRLGVGIGIVPLVLRRTQKMVSVPKTEGSGEMVRRPKWLLSIEADPDWIEAMFKNMNKLAYVTHKFYPELPEQIEDDDLAMTEAPDAYGSEVALNDPFEDTLAGDSVDAVLQGEYADFEDDDGLYDDPPFVNQPPQAEPAEEGEAFMPLDLAKTAKGKGGELYWDTDSKTLSNKTIGIGRLLKKQDLTEEQLEDANFKLAAIKAILNHRKETGDV